MNLLEKIINKKKFIPLNQFINIALYDKKLGYYQNKKIFGRGGDFITSPAISSIFSEMISVWIVSYWIYIKKPKKINILSSTLRIGFNFSGRSIDGSSCNKTTNSSQLKTHSLNMYM